MSGSVLGNRVRRNEDPELLTGQARYVADLDFPDRAWALFVRSDVAHAAIKRLDVTDVASADGVVAVFTAADLGVSAHHGFAKVAEAFAHQPLAHDVVRFVGDPIVLIVAESPGQAEDAAELVVIDYEMRDPVVDPEAALEPGAPLLFTEHGTNLAKSSLRNDVADILARCDRVVRGRFVNQRLAPVPLEPNTAAATVDEQNRIVLFAATQMPHLLQRQLAEALGQPLERVRVVAPHVGGGFGAKAGLYHEHVALAVAAGRTGRPVVWAPARSNDMIGLYHSRGQVQYVELGLSADGDFQALRVQLVADAGAYPNIGAMLPTFTEIMAQGPYQFDGVQFDYAVAATSTTPMGAYRGAGRPEATAYLERIVDLAASEMGLDPLELRSRNLLRSDDFPFVTHTATTYDSGDYHQALAAAAAAVDYHELRRQQEERRRNGSFKVLGIGIGSYVEVTAGGGGSEYGALEIHEDGTATIMAGTSAHGQGHATAYAMIVSEQTGIPVNDIRLVQSDTDLVRSGGGTGGSRSLQLAGSAVHRATESVLAKAKDLAGQLLEASPADIVIDTGAATVGVAGVPARALTWPELAAAAADPANADVVDHSDGTTGLAAQLDFVQDDGTFPFGTHIAVVEVDTETGQVELVRYVAVDDAGTVINPLLVEGQQHGGIAQGIAQALFEEFTFDGAGNPQHGSLMSYAIPSAAEFTVPFETFTSQTPTPLNPLGAKGIGEAATIGSTPAVQNAVIDALAHLGVRHLDMPCTALRVWQAIEQAAENRLPSVWREPPAVFDELRRSDD